MKKINPIKTLKKRIYRISIVSIITGLCYFIYSKYMQTSIGTIAAVEFTKSIEAQRAKIKLNIKLLEAKAKYKMAENWNGELPSNILPADSKFLMNLQ